MHQLRPVYANFSNKVRETGVIVYASTCTARKFENIDSLATSLRENPSKSTRYRSKELNIFNKSLP